MNLIPPLTAFITKLVFILLCVHYSDTVQSYYAHSIIVGDLNEFLLFSLAFLIHFPKSPSVTLLRRIISTKVYILVIGIVYMTKKINKNPKKESITIPRKAFIGIVSTFPVIGILLSRGDVGPLILFLMGIVVGILIGKGFFEE